MFGAVTGIAIMILFQRISSEGGAMAYFRPVTKFPHAGHVLLSIWASLLRIIMAMGDRKTGCCYTPLFFLSVAVWIAYCVIDIVFPLLSVKESEQ